MLTELKELRLKVMELETQVQVSTNQLRRQDEENKNLRDELEQAAIREREHLTKLREQQHRYSDLESKVIPHRYCKRRKLLELIYLYFPPPFHQTVVVYVL